MKRSGVLLSLTLTTLLCATQLEAAQKVYAAQLVTTDSAEKAETWMRKLPKSLRTEAYVYRSDSGRYSVRVWNESTLARLKSKANRLKKAGIASFSYVNTDPEKVAAARAKAQAHRGYAILLASYKGLASARSYYDRLPDAIREQAYLYHSYKGRYSVRVFSAERAAQLQSRLEKLKREGIPEARIVEIDKRKLPEAHKSSRVEPAAGVQKVQPAESRQRREPMADAAKRIGSYFDQAQSDCPPGLAQSFETTQMGGKPAYVLEEAEGRRRPMVDNVDSLLGTPKNRRVLVNIVPLSKRVHTKTLDFSQLDKGMYTVTLDIKDTYPLDRMYDAKIYLELPKSVSGINGSYTINGTKTAPTVKDGFTILGVDEYAPAEGLDVVFNIFARKDVNLSKIPYAIYAKTRNGKVVKTVSDPAIDTKTSERYFKSEAVTNPNRTEVKALRTVPKTGLLYPDADLTQAAATTDIEVAVPDGARYRVLLNGTPVPYAQMGERSVDKGNHLTRFRYIGLHLNEGKNSVTFELNGKVEAERTITVSSEAVNLIYSVYPEVPRADGKSPAYLVINTVDKEGNPARISTYIDVWVNKGDIFDYRTGQYKQFVNDQFKVKVVDGKAVVRLSPATQPEVRIVTARYGNMEREFKVRYFQEKRPWIVLGELDGGIGYSQTKNDPPKGSGMPFDHSKKGVNFAGDGAVFAKGNVDDYTVTMRYGTRQPDNVLMQQNIPSTEENQFYPVYGDDSEQYFEARSRDRLYTRIDSGLSYLLYGDFITDFGKEFDFNRYDRTFNGLQWNWQQVDDFRVNSFVTENKQDLVMEEQAGRGISGPYFVDNTMLEFTETVWIETRDRFNPQVVLSRVQKQRFTDYEINYTDGFIIFKEPIPEFDDNFNPVFIQVRYESDQLASPQYIYGARGEKWFDNLRIGLSGVNEQHPVNDKRLIGADFYYLINGFKFLGEAVRSEGYEDTALNTTSGNAYHVELRRDDKDLQTKLFYKKVDDGFQNPSATTAENAYQAYGFDVTKTMNDWRVQAVGSVDEHPTIDRKNVSLMAKKQINHMVSVEGGARYISETDTNTTTDYPQAIAGVQVQPTEKTNIAVRREQSLGSQSSGDYYPTRTVAKASYRWTQDTETYVQSEYQERAEKDVMLTTAGINSKIDEDTTAFSKYTIDDSVSGWRTQSHLGFNHVFHWLDGFAFDAGMENVRTFSGDEAADYTALRARGVYTQSERYKLSAGYEIRIGSARTDHLARVGGTFRPGRDYTLYARERYFLSEYRESDMLLGFARRPVGWDQLNYLLKLRWKLTDRDDITNKYICSTHLNYQPVQPVTLMGEYAGKFVSLKGVGTTYTDLLRGRVIYDLTDRIDVGLHGGYLHQYDTKTYTINWGPEVGVSPLKNFWVSLGYNFSGFYDNDFDEANYWAQGPYLKFRIKFDDETLRGLHSDEEIE